MKEGGGEGRLARGRAVLLARETIALRNSEERRRTSSSAAGTWVRRKDEDVMVRGEAMGTLLHAEGTRAMMSVMEGKLGGAAA